MREQRGGKNSFVCKSTCSTSTDAGKKHQRQRLAALPANQDSQQSDDAAGKLHPDINTDVQTHHEQEQAGKYYFCGVTTRTTLEAETWSSASLNFCSRQTPEPHLVTRQARHVCLLLSSHHPGAHVERDDVFVPLRQRKMAAVSPLQLPLSCQS